MKKLTPVLFVEQIEPSVRFWTERMGFQVVNEIREGDRLGFAILVKDGVEIMYQSRESLKKDVPALADMKFDSGISLYFEVEDINDVEKKIADIQKVVPRRDTFYGATEIAVREPGGHLVCFAQLKER